MILLCIIILYNDTCFKIRYIHFIFRQIIRKINKLIINISVKYKVLPKNSSTIIFLILLNQLVNIARGLNLNKDLINSSNSAISKT